MNQNSRIFLFRKIAISSGILTSFVDNNLNKNNFRQQFLKAPEGPTRDQLVYDTIIANGPPKEFVPVTVDGPGGIKITYNVMPDVISVNGLRIPLTAQLAQKIANHFNMHLPTAKMSRQIYDAADTKVRATPLSSSGYSFGDKHYSGADVAKGKIGSSDAAIIYSDKTDKEIQKYRDKSGQKPTLIAGHGKDLIQPISDPTKMSITGWYGENGKAIQPTSSPHSAQTQSEYGTWARLISDPVTITKPDGQKVTTTLAELQRDPVLSKAVSDIIGYKKYKT